MGKKSLIKFISLILVLFTSILFSCNKKQTLQIDKTLLLNKWSVDSILNYTSEKGIPYRESNVVNQIEFKSDGKTIQYFQMSGIQKVDTALYSITGPNTIDIINIYNGEAVMISDKMIISILTDNKLTFRLNTPTLNSAMYKIYYLHK